MIRTGKMPFVPDSVIGDRIIAFGGVWIDICFWIRKWVLMKLGIFLLDLSMISSQMWRISYGVCRKIPMCCFYNRLWRAQKSVAEEIQIFFKMLFVPTPMFVATGSHFPFIVDYLRQATFVDHRSIRFLFDSQLPIKTNVFEHPFQCWVCCCTKHSSHPKTAINCNNCKLLVIVLILRLYYNLALLQWVINSNARPFCSSIAITWYADIMLDTELVAPWTTCQ